MQLLTKQFQIYEKNYSKPLLYNISGKNVKEKFLLKLYLNPYNSLSFFSYWQTTFWNRNL